MNATPHLCASVLQRPDGVEKLLVYLDSSECARPHIAVERLFLTCWRLAFELL